MKKQVEGFSAYYIYEDGRLWSCHSGRFLIQFGIGRKSTNGKREYLAYKLCDDGFEKTFQAHRLVAKHFIDNPDNLPEVNHKDGNKANNDVKNLEWVSHTENVQHAFDTGLNDGRNWEGELHARSTFTNEEVEKFCEEFSEGKRPLDFAKPKSKLYEKLYRIWNRDNWKSISYKYVW